MNRKSFTSIQRQLQLFFVGTLALTVLVMGGAWIGYNNMYHEREAERVLIDEADIIGAAARPALMFRDQRLAGELMQNLLLDRDVASVKLFTYDGKELFSYQAPDDAAEGRKQVDFQKTQRTDYSEGRLSLNRVVLQKGQPVGVLYLESRLNHLKEMQSAGIMTVAVAMLGCMMMGSFLAFWLQGKITAPIRSLAGLMRQIGEGRDYSLRSNIPAFNRETEDLLVGFNQMAEEIENSFRTIKQNQLHLQKSEERFRNIVELAPVPVIVTRLSDSHILFYNQPALKLFGLNPSELGNLSALDFYRHPEDRQNLLKKLESQGELHGLELEVFGPDGKPIWITLSMNVMAFEGERALFSAFVDITEQKLVEQTLAENNQALEQRVLERTAALQSARDELQSTLDNMIDTYYRILADGTVAWASASVYALLGYQTSEVSGLTVKDVSVDGGAFSQVAKAMKRQGGAVINEQVQLRHKNGHAIWASVSAHWILDDHGQIHGVEGVVRDITPQVLAEQQKQEMEKKMVHVQRLESLGVLAGGIAHDFNNILASIMGNAELAELHVLEGLPVAKELGNIVAGSNKAADLCRQMLAYSGQGSLQTNEVNLSTLVNEALQLIDVSISKNISLTCELSDSLSDIHADKTQMQQIIMNLVTNAAESIGEEKPGNISIITTLIQAGRKDLESSFIEEKLNPGAYVLLEVVDDGCGMDKNTMEKIFDPFFTTKFTGRGLGMSAVLGIVRSHGGTIQVSSKPGRGATFRLLLPVSDAEQSVSVFTEEAVVETGKQRAGCTVLVVDDEAMIRNVVQRLLERLDCKVILAEDGESGVETYRQHNNEIDVILLDLTMPVMGGKEALQKIRELDESLPVFICSGYGHEDVESKFENLRPNGFLQKPFSLQALTKMLDQLAGLG